MPRWRGLLAHWPHSVLQASEGAVGLPPGQMGNSEVGHLNLGAGRPVLQDLPRIDAAIADGSFDERPALLDACERARLTGRLHTVGLVGPGGVHANDRHLLALVRLAAAHGVPSVRVHALLDGRDTPPSSALGYVRDLEDGAGDRAPGRADRDGGRALLGDGPRPALGPGRARVRRDRARGGGACVERRRGNRGRLRPGRDRRVRRADGHRRGRWDGPRSRPDRPRQLPRRPRPTADPRPRRHRVRRLRPHRPRRPAAAARRPRRDDDRVRGRPAGRGRLRARGGEVARAGVLRGRLDAVPRRGDREVRPRDLLLQRRTGGGVARRGAAARAVPAGRDVRPPAGDERRGRDRRAGRGDRVRPLRLHRRELREPGHGRPHRRVGGDRRRARGARRVPRPRRRRHRARGGGRPGRSRRRAADHRRSRQRRRAARRRGQPRHRALAQPRAAAGRRQVRPGTRPARWRPRRRRADDPRARRPAALGGDDRDARCWRRRGAGRRPDFCYHPGPLPPRRFEHP